MYTRAGQEVESDLSGIQVEAGTDDPGLVESLIPSQSASNPVHIGPHRVLHPVARQITGGARRGRELLHDPGEVSLDGLACPYVLHGGGRGTAALVPQDEDQRDAQLIDAELDRAEHRLVEGLPGRPYRQQVPEPLVEDELGRHPRVDTAEDERERVLGDGHGGAPGGVLVRVDLPERREPGVPGPEFGQGRGGGERSLGSGPAGRGRGGPGGGGDGRRRGRGGQGEHRATAGSGGGEGVRGRCHAVERYGDGRSRSLTWSEHDSKMTIHDPKMTMHDPNATGVLPGAGAPSNHAPRRPCTGQPCIRQPCTRRP